MKTYKTSMFQVVTSHNVGDKYFVQFIDRFYNLIKRYILQSINGDIYKIIIIRKGNLIHNSNKRWFSMFALLRGPSLLPYTLVLPFEWSRLSWQIFSSAEYIPESENFSESLTISRPMIKLPVCQHEVCRSNHVPLLTLQLPTKLS